MKKNGLIALFVALAAGAVLLSWRFAPMPADRALLAAVAQLRQADHLAGVATIAGYLPPAQGAGTGSQSGGSGTAGFASSSHGTGVAHGTVAVAATQPTPFALRGAFRLQMPKNGPSSGDALFKLAGEGDDQGMFVELRALGGGTSGGTWYLRADHLPDGALAGRKTADINGKWWSISASATVLRDLRDAMTDGALLVTDGKSSTEPVGGVMAYRYTLGLEPHAAAALADRLRASFPLVGATQSAGTHEVQPMPEKESASATQSASGQSSVVVSLWVDRRDGRPVQLGISLPGATTTSPGLRTVVIESLDFSTPVTVSVPEGARPMSELLQSARPTGSGAAGSSK